MKAIKRFLNLESSTPPRFNATGLLNGVVTEYDGPEPPYETLESPDAKVYVTWDPKNPPSRPTEPGWTRIICVSDTHCRIFPVPEGDIFVHAGDLTHSVRQLVDYASSIRLTVARVVLQSLNQLSVGYGHSRINTKCKQFMHSLSDDLLHSLASIIAGNHDLTLDHDWYLDRGSRWHLTSLEVRHSFLRVSCCLSYFPRIELKSAGF